MRIRFELQSLSALGSGVHRLPINCWRLTVQYMPAADAGRVLLNGTDYFADLSDVGNNPVINKLAQFTVGGVCLPNGAPVNLDQVLILTVVNNRRAFGMLIYEYLEP